MFRQVSANFLQKNKAENYNDLEDDMLVYFKGFIKILPVRKNGTRGSGPR